MEEDRTLVEEGSIQTSSDANWFSRSSSNTSNTLDKTAVSDATHAVFDDNDSAYYDMSGKKHLIIFNHYQYHNNKYSKREGTFNDVFSLRETFKNLGFKVTPHLDLTYDEIIDAVSDLCNADHKDTSCVAIVILTHGERNGYVCASDHPYELSDVITMLQKAPNLAGKPKLMFVQACRGNKIDSGYRIKFDGVGDTIVIPTHADWLILYSSIEEHLAYRDRDGSWLIQSLCKTLDEKYKALDILQVVTLVNRSVAFRDTYTPSNKATHLKKQMPEVRFTLTKFLKF